MISAILRFFKTYQFYLIALLSISILGGGWAYVAHLRNKNEYLTEYRKHAVVTIEGLVKTNESVNKSLEKEISDNRKLTRKIVELVKTNNDVTILNSKKISEVQRLRNELQGCLATHVPVELNRLFLDAYKAYPGLADQNSQ